MNKCISFFVLAAVLGGCAGVGTHGIKVRSVNTFGKIPTSGAPSAYEAGKSALADGNPALAIEAFRKDLVQRGPRVQVLNGLAVSYSDLGRLDLAEKYFEDAFQLDRFAPDTAYNFARMRYGQGKFDEARQFAELAHALALDCKVASGQDICPLVAEAAKHVADLSSKALVQIANDSTSETMVRRSGVGSWKLTVPEKKAEAVPLSGSHASVPFAAPLMQSPIVASREVASRESVKSSFQPVRVIKARQDQLPTSIKPVVAPKPEHIMMAAVMIPREPVTLPAGRAKLHIVNGVGVTRMARRMAQYLREKGETVNGLANARSYTERQSIIRYRSGSRDMALALARKLPPGIRLIEASLARSDIELTLGRDLLAFDRSLRST